MEVIWTLTADAVEAANVTRLQRAHGVGSYAELLRRSQDEPEWFWPAAIEDLGIEFSTPFTQVYDDSQGPEWITWFGGGRLNIADVCVHRHGRGPRAAAAAASRSSTARAERHRALHTPAEPALPARCGLTGLPQRS
jgi:acetyl-CoA synthetase